MIDLLSFLATMPSLSTLAVAPPSNPADLKIWAYVAFITLVLFCLALDLGVFHREAHEVGMKEAITWSVIWLTCGVLFTGVVYMSYEKHWLGLGLDTPKYSTTEAINAGAALIVNGEVRGFEAAKQYLTGYVVEKSLAMDNIFVIALIFTFFAVPGKYQHRVLFWGILGALVLRGVMIYAGTTLVERFAWTLYVFGALLLGTAIKLLFQNEEKFDPEKGFTYRIASRVLPLTPTLHGQAFYTHIDGKRVFTPLFLVLLIVETTDVVFAVDSIPAIIAITTDKFLVFTSNVFAILGLRSMYFALSALMDKFKYLKFSLAFILAFVGVKMLIKKWHHFGAGESLGMIAGALILGIGVSLYSNRNARRSANQTPSPQPDPPHPGKLEP